MKNFSHRNHAILSWVEGGNFSNFHIAFDEIFPASSLAHPSSVCSQLFRHLHSLNVFDICELLQVEKKYVRRKKFLYFMLKNNIKRSWIIIKIEKYFPTTTQNTEQSESKGRKEKQQHVFRRIRILFRVIPVVEAFYKWHLMELIESWIAWIPHKKFPLSTFSNRAKKWVRAEVSSAELIQ